MGATRRVWMQDGALALALTAWNQWELTNAEFVDGAVLLNHLTFASMTLAVAFRREMPLACASLAGSALAAQTIWGGDVFGASAQFVALLVAMHAAGSHPVRSRAWAGLIVMMIGVEVYPFVSEEPVRLEDEVGNIAVFVAVWGLARAVQVQRERREGVILDQERREREVLEFERARVARELHDIVAHGLALMVLHAGAARSAPDPVKAAESLDVVEESGRRAMTELHRMLGMLSRPDAGGARATAGLDDVRELADQTRRAGVPVSIDLCEPPAGMDQSIELSAYRVVQEAITNALRHGTGEQVDVTVTTEPNSLVVTVLDHRTRADQPRRRAGGVLAGTGRGLKGLAERVELFGGTFSAGRTSAGWQVRAVFPLGDPT